MTGAPSRASVAQPPDNKALGATPLEVTFLEPDRSAALQHGALATLIEAIGSATFEQAILAFAARASDCTHFTAFARCRARPPRILVAIDQRQASIARRIGEKYLRDYWDLDPANRLAAAEPRVGRGAIIRIRNEEIENPAYRRDCYNSLRIVDRFSILQSVGSELVRLNFYRDAARGRFSDAEIKPLADLAGVLAQLVLKHDQLRPGTTDEERCEIYFARLSGASFGLSGREAQVCAEIVLGRSSEAIAIKLGLSINTILTHRKNAYAKLGISSQNELSRLVLQ